MTSRKTTKRALVLSVLAMVMCVAMLVGTTFAWFTDTASTGVNRIQAGNLDVDIVGADGKTLNGKTLSFKNVNGETDILWEPGATFQLDSFKIVNKGNLALKYRVTINGVDGEAKLLKAIDFTVKVGEAEATKLEGWEGVLLPQGKTAEKPEEAVGETELVTISGTMKSEAGNEYQGESLEGIGITVEATQYTYEEDSFNDQYDKNATYAVADYAGLKKAFEYNGTYNVTEDITVDGTLATYQYGNVTLNAAGKTISNTEDIWNNGTASWSLVSARGNAKLTIAGGNFIAKENDCYAADVQGGSTLIIKDGTYVGNTHAVYVEKGTAIIEGGTFSVQRKYPQAGKEDEFVLNCLDGNHANGTAKIIVTGGTFINFNPADCAAEGEHTNFVADGYKVVSEVKGADTYYTVIPQ